MTMLNTKITESGVLYIPKEVRESFGRNMKIITNTSSAVMFSDKTDYEDVLISLEIIQSDLRHRISLRDKERINTEVKK